MASGLRNQGTGFLIPYRGALHDIAKHLKKKDIAHIAFQFPKLSTAQRDTIQDGIELFEELERIGELSATNIDRLIEAIGKIQLQEPLRRLKEYKADYLTSVGVEQTGNKAIASVRVISLENDNQAVETDGRDARGGKVERIHHIIETKQESERVDVLHGVSTESNSKVLMIQNETSPCLPCDDFPDSLQEEFPDKDGDKVSSTCKEHKEVNLNKYCLTCSRRICVECAFLFHKSQCEVIPIHGVAEKVEEQSLELQQYVKTVNDNCETVKVESDRRHKVHLRNLDKLEKEIRDDAMKMRESVDREEYRLLSIVQEKKKEIDEGTSDQSDFCLDVTNKLRTIDQTCSEITSNCKTITRWEALTKLKQEVNKLQNTLDEQFLQTFQSPVYQHVSNKGTFGMLKYWHLLGGVIIKPNQLLHIYDNRKTSKGVLLVCCDPGDSKSIFWQYEENRVSQEYPLVMSRRAMYYKEYFHALFACGKAVYVVHFHSDGSTYDGVKSIEMLELDSLEDGVWITSLFCHQPSGAPCDHFILSTSLSDRIIEYSISSKEKRMIKLTGFVSRINIKSIAYLKNRFAIISGGFKVIILLIERENTHLSYLPEVESSSAYKPVEVISTGARWIVLYMNQEVEICWKVLVYKIKTGDMRVCDEGQCDAKASVPISVAHCQRNGFLCFSNGDVRSFEF